MILASWLVPRCSSREEEGTDVSQEKKAKLTQEGGKNKEEEDAHQKEDTIEETADRTRNTSISSSSALTGLVAYSSDSSDSED